MGWASWLKELPLDRLTFVYDAQAVFIPEDVWDSLNRYEGTLPTAPSPGRVYRRGPFLRIVAEDMTDLRYQIHVSYWALVT